MGDSSRARSPIAAGVLLAVGAALAFGIAAPIVAWAGRAIGPFTTAALLYAGAALAASLLGALRREAVDAPVRRADAPRVIAVALVGGALAPTLLAWGLQRSGPTIGALLLNLEAVFTVALAWLAYREPVGPRVAAAVAAMVAGGAALALDASHGARWELAGIAAIAGATLAWAADNTLTRPLAEREPLQVIAWKGGLGALVTAALAMIRGEPLPPLGMTAVLLACGATGYGLSLRMYLLAQRRIGAGRTGSVFALAPFVGAALALALGDRAATGWTAAAAGLFALGVWLHVGEQHGHPHVHAAETHAHPHRHDDGHHDHAHADGTAIVGEHSHAHAHVEVAHAHDHAPDVHHAHRH